MMYLTKHHSHVMANVKSKIRMGYLHEEDSSWFSKELKWNWQGKVSSVWCYNYKGCSV